MDEVKICHLDRFEKRERDLQCEGSSTAVAMTGLV